MAITTTTILPPAVQEALNAVLISTPTPNYIHTVAAMKKRMPKNQGNTMILRGFNDIDSATVPLGNTGITPPSQELTAFDLRAEVSYYGTYIEINERVTLTLESPVLNQGALKLGKSMRKTEDEITRNMLLATATMVFCTGGANGDNPTNVTEDDVSDVVSALLTNDATTITENIVAADKYGSSAVRDAFFGLCHTKLSKELDSVPGFTHKHNYSDPSKSLRSEWGAIGNVRFLLSSIGSVTSNASDLGADVYDMFICGMESYAIIDQDGYTSQFIYRDPMLAGGPLAQNCTIAWKMAQVPRIIHDQYIFNLRCTLS